MAPSNQRKRALMTSTLVLAVATPALLALAEAAQPRRPDFSGRWTNPVPVDATGAEARGQNGSRGSGWGREFTIDQNDGVLTVTRVFFTRYDLQPAIKLRYPLDGSAIVNTILMGRGAQQQKSTTAWDGDRLIITTHYEVPASEAGSAVTYEEVRTLSLQPPPAGRNAWPPSLTMEILRKGVLGGPSSTTRLVFSREY
jgi:hypothetical protein